MQTTLNNLQTKKSSGKNAPQNRPLPMSCRICRTSADIPILLKTTDLLIVNKPAGIPVHGSGSVDMLLSADSQRSSVEPQQCDGTGCNPLQSLSFKQGPLHRLDKNTTGILCFSQTLAGAQWFSQCLREKRIGKYYLGVVRGAMQTQHITAEVSSGMTITQCYLVRSNKELDASLMLFRLITGKKHQIRKHAMNAGHPLIGDRTYCGGSPISGCNRYLLHAWRLYFPAARPADIPAFIEAPLFFEMEVCLDRYFRGWRQKAADIFTNQMQAVDNF